MRRLTPSLFSSALTVRLLQEDDLSQILSLCHGNTLFYTHGGETASEDSIRRDMALLPPGKTPSDKYYAGFFRDGQLAAVLDLIDGYPDTATAFIGFFMVRADLQGQGFGSAVIADLCRCLETAGFSSVQLAWEKANPQASRFWQKNRFVPQREVSQDTSVLVVGQRNL